MELVNTERQYYEVKQIALFPSPPNLTPLPWIPSQPLATRTYDCASQWDSITMQDCQGTGQYQEAVKYKHPHSPKLQSRHRIGQHIQARELPLTLYLIPWKDPPIHKLLTLNA